MNNLKFNQEKTIDLIAIGRLAIDLNANEINRPMEETITFTKYVGGSPANIAIGTAVLGHKAGFIGRVADDQFGRFIVSYLKEKDIDTSNIAVDQSGAKTGLAFTEIKSPTDCSILMYRENAVDLKLEPKDIKEEYIKQAKTILISGTALAQSPSREAVFLALDFARKHDVVVFFDIDYRPYTWKSTDETSVYYNLAAEKCDVIIGTREEFDMMESLTTPGNDNDFVTAKKWFDYNAKIVVIKHGKEGSISYTKEGESFRGRSFPAKVVKTFGAGDSYASAFIYGLMEGWNVDQSMEFGGASASIVISRHSCSDAMPTAEEVKTYIEKCKKEEEQSV